MCVSCVARFVATVGIYLLLTITSDIVDTTDDLLFKIIMSVQQTGEAMATSYLLQRISMAVQRGNAAAIMGCARQL